MKKTANRTKTARRRPKKKKKTGAKTGAKIGRPPKTDPAEIKTENIQFRLTASETILLDLAAILANYRNRSQWARNRLIYLGKSLCKSHGINASDSVIVKRELQKRRRT